MKGWASFLSSLVVAVRPEITHWKCSLQGLRGLTYIGIYRENNNAASQNESQKTCAGTLRIQKGLQRQSPPSVIHAHLYSWPLLPAFYHDVKPC